MKSFYTVLLTGLLLSGLIFELTKECPNIFVIYSTVTLITLDIWYLLSSFNITINVNERRIIQVVDEEPNE